MNKTVCNSFQNIDKYIDNILFKTSLHGSFLSSKVELINKLFTNGLNKLKSQIKKCSKINYNWKAQDACLSASFCFKKRQISNNFIENILLRQ